MVKELINKTLSHPLFSRIAASPIAKRLAKGSFWSILGSATSRVLILIAMILVARVLGQTSFGEFGLIQVTLGVAGLMAGMGLGGTATRFTAQYSLNDPTRAGKVIALVTLTSITTVTLISLILVIFSYIIASRILNAPHLWAALICGTFLMATTSFRGIQNGVLAGLEKFDILAKLNVLDGLIALISMVVLSRLLGVNGAILGLTLGAITSLIAGHLLLCQEFNRRRIRVTWEGCWRDKHILTKFSLPSFLANVVATPVLWYAMTLVANIENGYDELGLYNASYQWHGPIVFIPMILMSVSIPILVQEWESGRKERFRTISYSILGLTLLLSVPPAIFVALLSPWIMSLYGQGFKEGWIIMVLLLAAAPMHGISKISSSALLAMNHAWWVLSINLIWGISFLALASWLVNSRGALGLAIAFFTSYCISAMLAFSLILIGSKHLKA